MTRFSLVTLAGVCAGWLMAQPVQAQEQSQCSSQKAWTIDKVGKDYLKLTGQAEVDCGDMKFYADQYIEIFSDVKRVVAVGNVVFVQENKRIAADRADFNYGTKIGTFYHAAGVASLGDRPDNDQNRPGSNSLAVNQLGMYSSVGDPLQDQSGPRRGQKDQFGTQEPDVYFYGETIEKIGEEKYRVTKGGFTTCVQPTPRWELVSGSVTLNLDHYAWLKNSVFKMKGVPILYFPVFYYPINKEDRSTGILIPAYGSSTIKGQTLSNAFFWAINRSHDATLMHDWFSKTGQGYGGEYRNVTGRRSQAYFRTYFLKEHEAQFTDSTGKTTITPPRESYELQGNANQSIGTHLAARGRIDYFSDITVQQIYHQSIYEASRRQRALSGSLTGIFGPYTLNGTFDRREVFFGTTSSTLTGALPRFSASRAERPLFGSPLYFSITGDYATMLRRNQATTKTLDSGLNRGDFQPVLRFPFTHWQFLTVNSSVGYRNTYWTESRQNNVQVPVPIWRRYFDMQSHIVGPVFNRIWNTPNNGYAEKFKHSIEPFMDVQKTTAIDNLTEIVQLDSVDSIIGNATRVTYGLSNRFYAKRPGEGIRGNLTPEIITVSLRQTYYTDARASQVDPRYNSSFTGTQPSKLSPISLLVKAAPTAGINATMRMDYDTQFNAIRTIGADGIIEHGGWIQAIAGWSQRRLIQGLQGFNDPTRLAHYINGNSTLHTVGNRVGGSYSFNYDVKAGSFLQQRFLMYYNAQCCGFSWEFQQFDFSRLGSRAPVPKDSRMNFSITLAGIGGFSNFFGALGGAPNR